MSKITDWENIILLAVAEESWYLVSPYLEQSILSKMIKILNLVSNTLLNTLAAISVTITEAQGNSSYLEEDSKSMWHDSGY